MFLVAPRGRLIGKHGKGRDCSVETYAPHACCGTNIGPQAEAARSRHLPDRHSRRLAREAEPLSRNAYPTAGVVGVLPARGSGRSIGTHVQPSSHTLAASYGIRTAQSEHSSNRCRYVERTVRVPPSTPHVTVQADCGTSAWPDRGRRRSQADYRDRRRCEPPVRRSRREHGTVC